jgi:hypothetical protein
LEKNLYNIALQDVEDTGEDVTVLAFKAKYKLETGFYKKPIEFFYWLFKKENSKISENKFKLSFIGRMVKFDKKNIPNYMELVLEYERNKKEQDKRKANRAKKAKIERLSKARQDEIDQS